jgi:hypothetical protein
MIVSQAEVRARIEQIKLNFDGYMRQLRRGDLTGDRRGRLESDVRLLEEELNTLEKIAQLGRVEADRGKIEQIVRERLEEVRGKLAANPSYAGLAPEQRDLASGEVGALLWALQEDRMTHYSRELSKGHDPDPSRTDRAVPGILVHTLQEGPSVEARASAAYELGAMHIPQSIPALVAALEDDPFVAEIAMRALSKFSDEELTGSGLDPATLAQLRSRET